MRCNVVSYFQTSFVICIPCCIKPMKTIKGGNPNKGGWIQDENKEYVETKWFRIERYECTLVKRDRNLWNDVMPQIIRFWKM